MMVINNKFKIGQIVYVKTDISQDPGIIISFECFAAGEVVYKIKRDSDVSSHYDFELSRSANAALKYAGSKPE